MRFNTICHSKSNLSNNRTILACLVFGGLFSFCGSQTLHLNPDGNENLAEVIVQQLSSKVDTIYLGYGKKAWEVGPIVLRNLKDKTIILAEGLEVKAKKGAFPNKSDALLKLVSCENLTLIGNGSRLKMNKSEYTSGEWRHAISIRGGKNITLSGLKIYDSGGDGVYISGNQKGTYAQDVYLKDILSSNNKRQGISVISAKNVFVEDCIFEHTKGTPPGAGVDIEPNHPDDRLVNVNFTNCTFRNNYHAGILISVGRLTAQSTPVSINFDHCYLTQNHDEANPQPSSEIVISANKKSPVGGTVNFRKCMIENSKWGFLYSRKRSDAFHVTFSECAAIAICKNNTGPIYLEVPDYKTNYGPLGGFTFEKMHIASNTEKPFLQIRGSQQGTLSKVKDINGSFTLTGTHLDSIKYIKYNPENNENVRLDYVTQKE